MPKITKCQKCGKRIKSTELQAHLQSEWFLTLQGDREYIMSLKIRDYRLYQSENDDAVLAAGVRRRLNVLADRVGLERSTDIREILDAVIKELGGRV